jgi:hypothetical protein
MAIMLDPPAARPRAASVQLCCRNFVPEAILREMLTTARKKA